MPTDQTLTKDEERRLAQHEEVKAKVVNDVQAKILEDADQVAPDERQHVERVARDLKRKAIDEVGEKEHEIRRGRAVIRMSQVVDYLFCVVYGLIGLQVVLEMIGAREGSGFKQFMNTVTAPLLAPFRGLVVDPGVGPFQFMLSYVMALLIYGLLHLAVRGLLRIFVSRRTAF